MVRPKKKRNITTKQTSPRSGPRGQGAAIGRSVEHEKKICKSRQGRSFGQILRFELKEFLFDALGITVEANGSFEFDNEDLETFEGIPRPMGTASLKIKGSNAFIDRLENMQLLPSETIMGARMILALIMRATGDDILLSEFEIDEKGKVYANGQRLR